MARPNRKDPLQAATAYDIYIYHHLNNQPEGQNWERRCTTPCPKRARAKAKDLHKSKNFTRVEIRKKYFDAKKRRNVDRAIKVYGHQPERFGRRVSRILKIGVGALAAYILALLAAQNGL